MRMHVLNIAAWMGGVGGVERALHSVLGALAEHKVDVVCREPLSGPHAVGPHPVACASAAVDFFGEARRLDSPDFELQRHYGRPAASR